MALHDGCLRDRTSWVGRPVDITVQSAGPEGRCLAPTWELVRGAKGGNLSWEAYTAGYYALLRERWLTDPVAKEALVNLVRAAAADEITLCCYCVYRETCHRSLAVDLLLKVADRLNLDVRPVTPLTDS